MRTVKTFTNLAEAGFARSLLDAAGISAFLADEQSSQYSLGAVVPIRLQVEEPDVERAIATLKQPPDGETSVEPSPERMPEDAEPQNSDRGIPVAVFVALAVSFVLLALAALHDQQSRRAASRPPAVKLLLKH